MIEFYFKYTYLTVSVVQKIHIVLGNSFLCFTTAVVGHFY